MAPDSEVLASARAQAQAGDIVRAAGSLESLCRTAPTAEAWCLLGAMRGQQGRFEECLAALDAALALDANHVDAQYNRAQAYMHLGRPTDAIAAYREVVRLSPDHAAAWNNLGYALGKAGVWEEAIHCHRQALTRRPNEPEILLNLGNALAGAGKSDEAIASYRSAIRVRPDYAEAHFYIARILAGAQQLPAAVVHFRAVLRINPDHFEALRGLGQSLKQLGDLAEAAHWFREALRVNPGHAATRFQLATVTNNDEAPDKAPATYVANLFDSYARHFDDHLVRQLDYRTPQMLNALVSRTVGEANEKWTVLDLGCGTGLGGALFRDRASRLVGVDLSANMIEAARAKALYDELHESDVVTFLEASAARYDLVIAADVFPYLGDLRPAFRACRAALSPLGLFAFSVEASQNASAPPFELRVTARYAHTDTYLRTLARETGFVELGLERGVIRMNGAEPVHGYIMVLRAF